MGQQKGWAMPPSKIGEFLIPGGELAKGAKAIEEARRLANCQRYFKPL